MAPNSLFAVLLRSPWWISLLVALAFIGVSHALLPQDLRVFGAMGGIPFWVIAGIAGWRQLRAPSAQEAQQVLEAAQRMPWPQFSAALAQGFTREGHTVEPGTGAADLVLRQGGRTLLVAAKRWKAARHGEDALQPLLHAVRAQDASGGVYVTTGELSAQARKLATAHGVRLVGAPELVLLLRAR